MDHNDHCEGKIREKDYEINGKNQEIDGKNHKIHERDQHIQSFEGEVRKNGTRFTTENFQNGMSDSRLE